MQQSALLPLISIVVGVLSSALTLAVKGWLDIRLESKRALLSKGSRLYEKRVEVITTLYALLRDTEALYQQITNPVVYQGEPPRTETSAKAFTTYQSFITHFFRTRVLLPEPLVARTEALVKAFWDAGLRYNFATNPEYRDGSQVQEWTKVREIVQDQVPALLNAFEQECRSILEPTTAAA